MTIELGTLIAITGTVSGIVFGYIGFQRVGKKETRDGAKEHTELKTNLDYIRRGIDDIRIDLKSQENRVTELTGAVIRLEESTKSAHKRIDSIESSSPRER